MQYYGKAEEIGQKLLAAFQAGTVPQALAPIFIRHGQERHCGQWSWANQLIVAIHGYTDARTYNGWQQVGRQVRKGEKAFLILEPVKIRVEDEVTGEQRTITVGFKAGPRFGLEQTSGEPLPQVSPEQQFIDSLPLLAVAQAWGLRVATYNGTNGKALGYFKYDPVDQKGLAIALGVENLSTWTHELVHAADLRLGNLGQGDEKWVSETVAELGGCILLHMLGHAEEADDGGAWEYIRAYAEGNDVDPLAACMEVLQRTCEAVSLIMDTSTQAA